MGKRVVLGTVALAVFAVSVMVLTSLGVAANPAPPEWQNQTQAKDSINPGESNVLSAQGRSDVGLDSAWLATNEGGTWKEYKTGIPTTGWWDGAWGKRVKLQIDNSGQSEDLLDFPLLVVLGPSRISYGDFKTDGADIRFVDTSGSALEFHIEKWDTSASSYVWVRVPKITANSASDYVWLYYDNPSAPDVQHPATTYDSNFVGVWHLSETSAPVRDSTLNANQGTPSGATYTSSGRIDGGYSFNGAGNFIGVPASTSLDLIGGSFTMEAWVKFGTVNNARLISRSIDSTPNNAYQLISDEATKKWGVQVKEGGTDKICAFSSSLVSSGSWYYVAAAIEKVGTDYSGSKLYVNGVEVTMTTSAGAIGANGASTDLFFGKRADGYSSTYLSGVEDEVRLSSVARSASWIKATYLTGSDSIITYGTVESTGFTPEKHGSPIMLNGVSNTWADASFTWSNSSIRGDTAISWRIVFKDTNGIEVSTPEKTFTVLKPLNALVLVNSQSPDFADFQGRIYPYLKHFGIPYNTLDVSNTPVTAAIGDYPLIIIGHSSLDPAHAFLDSSEQSLIVDAVNQGSGLVNFDFDLQSGGSPIYSYVQTIFGFAYGSDYSTAGPITIVTNQSYITSQQQEGSSYSLSASVTGANIVGASSGVSTLVSIGGHPLVAVTTCGQGKAVQFSAYNFLDWTVFGYFQGIDDVFWKSFVWAAEKPFVMRGIPPFVTMRFDDCNGPYAPYFEQLNGFTPMVSSFLATGDLDTLKSYALAGEILVSVHEDTIGLDANTAPGFWSQYNTTFAGIPMAHSWHAHVAETSSALIPGMKARGIDLFCTDCDFDTYLGNVGTNRWAPYMVDQHSPAARNAYIFEDWCKVDPSFFNYYSNAWAYGSPLNSVFIDNHMGDVQGAINEGVARVERALNSQTWGLLMTHEFAIEGFGYENFGITTAAIKARLAADGYAPMYTDIDTIGYYVRAAAGTSHLSYASIGPNSDAVTLEFTGSADVPTKFYLFTGANDNIQSTLVDVPTFTNGFTMTTGVPTDTTAPVISNVGSQSIAESSATITWDTNEAADSRVDYGTSTLDNEVYRSVAALHHSIQLATLTPDTTYSYKVSSTDAYGNTAESTVLQFTTAATPPPPPFSLLQTTYEDFASGTVTNTFVTNDTGGEVMLKPGVLDHFDDSNVNTDIWTATRGQYTDPGGLVPFAPTITDSIITMDNPDKLYGGGARLMSNDFYSPPITIEGRIKLTQNGAGCLFGLYDWASDHDWYVDFNCLSGTPNTRVSLPGYSATKVVSFDPNQFHILRIEYTSTTIKFYVDGALVDSRTGSFSTPMPILFGTFPTGPTYADWIRIDTFPVTAGTYLSAVLDAQETRQWDTLQWTANTPAGTSLTFSTRTSTDGSVWSDWSATTTSSGSQIASPDGRCIQYSVNFVTTSQQLSPVLEAVKIVTRAGGDNTAPVVTITAPTDGAYYTTASVPVAGYIVSELNPYTVIESGYSTSEGVHTYTVTATDGDGNIGTASVTYTVDNTPPVASFTASMSWTTVSVDASASYDMHGLALTYAWDFGDGEHAIGRTATHAYAANGSYIITLTVMNSLGLTDTGITSVTASTRAVFDLILKPGWNFVSIPLADFTYNASTLGLATGDMICIWDSAIQHYSNSYIVGISPHSQDFKIESCTGYWVWVKSEENLTLLGYHPDKYSSYSIPLDVPAGGGWVSIGLTSFDSSRHASDLASYVSGTHAKFVCKYNTTTQRYLSYIVGFSPPAYNFNILPGDAMWLWVDGPGGTLTYFP